MDRRKMLLMSLLGTTALLSPSARAQAVKPLKIGVINDMTSVYADYQGIGSVIATNMAIADHAERLGIRVEVVSADHQNKPDIGSSIARSWYDIDGVDVIMDAPNSAVALAVIGITKDKNKVFIGSGAGSSVITGAQCTPNTVHWTYDTWSLGHSLGKALVAEGGKTWFFITADYAFGKDLEKSASDAVEAAGGKVLGVARHPLNTADFSSYLLQAQASGADVVAFANAGGDTNNSIKQAAEFGLGAKQRLAGLILNVTNIPGLGMAAVQNVKIVTGFYWDRTDDSRAFAKRFSALHPRKAQPNDMHAGMYAATLHLMKAYAQVKSAADGKALVDAMKAMPTDDPLFGKGSIRVDGRKLHPMYLLATKTVAESKSDWDSFNVVRTIAVEDAWRPLAEGGCAFAKG